MDIFKIDTVTQILKAPSKIGSPLPLTQQSFLAVSQNGNIFQLKAESSSCPSAIQTTDQGSILIADLAHQSIFIRQQQNNQISNIVAQYNNRALIGPSSMCIDSSCLFFTDSGPFNQTSLQNPKGSVYVYRFQDHMLKALIPNQLAYPCSIISAGDNHQKQKISQKFLLVCELGQNRILKVVLDQNFHGNYTVFHQFSGKLGPSSITFNNGYYFVSLFQFNTLASSGSIAVLDMQGQFVQMINVEGIGSQINGIKAIPSQQPTLKFLITEGQSLYQLILNGQKDLISQQQLIEPISNLKMPNK